MIFHRPMIHETMTSKTADEGDNDPASDAVAFAAYFAALASLDPEECVETFGQDYSSLQQHYRFATQQALARANFLESQNLAVLQATTLFLTCLRHPKDASFVLAMAALVQRTAQEIGLHRDGSNFDLDPFQVEIRRRLWWSIYLLDSRSSEFHAMRPQIAEESYDTRLPFNINSLDISPDMTEAPEERTGFTDMTFCLSRCEMTVLYRRFHRSTQGNNTDERNSQVVERRLHELRRIHTQLQQRYLQHCDVSLPLQWVTATVIRLALARSWLLAHIPETPTTGDISQLGIHVAQGPDRQELFVAAIEVVEFAYLLEVDPRTKQWSWLFEGYPQWHSLVFVLTELCLRPQTPALVDQAWGVATQAVTRWINADFDSGGSGITPKIVFQLMRGAASVLGRSWEEPGSTCHGPSLGGSVTSHD
ncbi:fungal-specific transcription factor domain-containing protein [Aspergillus germanicus]